MSMFVEVVFDALMTLEILQRSGHVDWWSLGTLMFHMLTGAVSVLHCAHMCVIVSPMCLPGYVTICTVCPCISECVCCVCSIFICGICVCVF